MYVYLYMSGIGMELGPQNNGKDSRLGPNSVMVVYIEPLGYSDNTGPETSYSQASFRWEL